MKLPFQKFEGAENDFIFLETHTLPPDHDPKTLAEELCSRKTSIGADGLVLIRDYQSQNGLAQFTWDFYNSDGSEAKMCGNAARCAVVYSYLRSQALRCEFQTKIGTLRGTYKPKEPLVVMPLASPKVRAHRVMALDQEITGFKVDSGVPHFVILQNEYAPFSSSLSLALQQSPSFAPDGVNVTFLEKEGALRRTVSFERGVEDYTRACGTGAIACALVLHETEKQSQFLLRAPGGTLGVAVNQQTIGLSGPARLVCQGSAFLY